MKIDKRARTLLLIVLTAVLGLGMLIGGIVALVGGKGNAPDFKVLSENGKSVELSDYQGKPVVVNFWATWCGPCKVELPAFESAYKRYGDDVKFMMVNLTTWEEKNSVSAVKSFLKENSYDFPVYFDTKGSADEAYDIESIPLTLFIDENGDLVYSRNASMDEEALVGYIEKYLI